MSSYIPRALLDQARPETSDPSYRMSMLPFGTYPNENGSGEHLGFAVPGMVQEPMNALMRLIGTPSQPGTFTQGPDYGSNSEDMRTLLETFLGGNATKGAGAVERAAPDIGFLDSLKGKYLDYMHPDEYAPIGGSRMVRDYAGGNPANGMPLDPTVVSGLLNHHTPEFMGFPANSARGWTPSVVNSETGKPSLWGAMINALTGGNATRGMGAVERGVAEAPVADISAMRPRRAYQAPDNPMVAISPGTYSAYHGSRSAAGIKPRNVESYWGTPDAGLAGEYAMDAARSPNIAPVDFNFTNPVRIDAGGAGWAGIPFEQGYRATTELEDIARARGHDGLIIDNVIDPPSGDMSGVGSPSTVIAALRRGTVTSPLTGETLFSDQLPSLWGSALQGQNDQPYPNSLFGY